MIGSFLSSGIGYEASKAFLMISTRDPPASVAEHTARQFDSFESKGQRPWAALKRRLDRECPDYAT